VQRLDNANSAMNYPICQIWPATFWSCPSKRNTARWQTAPYRPADWSPVSCQLWASSYSCYFPWYL